MTNLIATMGPALFAPADAREAIRRGVSAIRFSASKFPPPVLADLASMVAREAAGLGRQVDLLLDLPGSKTRFSNDEGFPLEGIDRLRVRYGPTSARRDLPLPEIGMTGLSLGPLIEVGDILVIGDGEDALRVESCSADHCLTVPLTTGELGRRKGVSVRGKPQAYRALTDSDTASLERVADTEFSGVIISFVEDSQTLQRARGLIQARPNDSVPPPVVIAKVETRAGAEQAAAVAEVADAVLLGRGDLLMDAGELDFYDLSKKVLKAAQKSQTPVIVGTQLMTSLSASWLPNRSELAYASHLIEKGVNGFLLATETTVGRQPMRTIEVMTALIERYGEGPTRPMFPSRVTQA